MLLTITNTKAPASDLGYLLHKNPNRVQSFDLSFGKVHVFYPEASPNRCTTALLFDVDPVGLVRTRGGPSGEGGMLDQYVNDRQDLGRERLLEWARQSPADSPRALGEDLLQRLELFRGGLLNDDETLLVLQREEESRLVMLGEVANSYTFGRMLRSLKRENRTAGSDS